MRKQLPITSLLILALLSSAAASPVSAAAKAVVQKSIIDVGKVAQGTKIEHQFTLENQGDATLTVREVKPSCGCTIADYDKSIAAGDAGRIKAVVKTDNFTGPIAKSISVFTSDSDNPKITLVIKAIVQPQIEVEPGYARFIVIEGAGTESRTQKIWTAEGPPLEIRAIRSPFPFLEASFSRAEEEGEWRINLALDRNGAPIGPLADFVEVETNHPKQSVVKIPVSGFIQPVVSVTPRVAELGTHRLETPYTTTLEVRNQADSAIALQGVTADIAGMNASFEEVEEGQVFKVVLTLTPEMAKGPFQGKVQITTTSKRRPMVEVDVSGTVL